MSAAEILAAARARGESALSEHDAKRLLDQAGIPVTREKLAGDRDAAVAAGIALGFPVAVKGCHASLQHKTESDMVRLGIGDPAALARAYDDIAPRLPPGGLVLVQEMVAGRRELIMGLIRDPVFGPCVSLGLGGIFAEAIGDVVFRLAPFDRWEARAMIGELKYGAVLGTFRGMPAADLDALAAMLVAIGRIGCDHPSLREMDLNPVIIAGTRPVTVDALVIME